MKKLMMSMSLVSILVVSGCALFDSDATPRDKYIDAQEGFILAVTAAMHGHRAGVITDEVYADIVVPTILEGSALLDSMEVMVASGDVQQTELLRQSLLAVILRIQQYTAGG